MTSIAGLVTFDGQHVDAATLERVENVFAPYGRDASNRRIFGNAGLLRTLLRTTPEDAFDRQPLVHPASGRVLVFDGRLDNRADLIRELRLPADEAQDCADSALALQACLSWDDDAPSHFVGDFALALWSPRDARLWMARDPLGHRPLFWYRNERFFAFATLPKGLFAIPGVPRTLCDERLADLLTLIPMVGPESLFKDVYRVEPGRVVTVEAGKVGTRRYHTFDAIRELRFARDDDYLDAFREHLERAVASQLRSNGPIGSHLSSGFDSSTVTAVAARLLAARNQRLTAFTAVPRVNFDGPVPPGRHGDEGPGAAAVAARFQNIDHVLVRVAGTSPLDHLQQDVEALDRAPLNPCNMVWVDEIHRQAEERRLRVLLTGQMGNMTLSYAGREYLPALWRRCHWRRWWQETTALKREDPGLRWRGLLAQSIGPLMPAWLWSTLARMRGRGVGRLSDYCAIHPDFAERIGSRERARVAAWDLSYRPWGDGRRMRIAVLNRLDNGEHRAEANLHGLETRDPTSDLRLLEFCLSVPDHQYLRNGQTRWLLRRAMDGVLPPEILDAKTKGLQAADWYEAVEATRPAIRAELQRLMAHPDAARYLDLDTLMKDLDDWPEGGSASERATRRYRLKLLRGLSVGTFVRYVAERN